jgi:hypothetical protein
MSNRDKLTNLKRQRFMDISIRSGLPPENVWRVVASNREVQHLEREIAHEAAHRRRRVGRRVLARRDDGRVPVPTVLYRELS